MPDDPAFIRMIAAVPDDDAPRLVYADYLEETGDPAKMARAEFIRVQIEMARLVPDTPRWIELWEREVTLLNSAWEWLRELPAFDEMKYGGFVRGFVEHISAPAELLPRELRHILDTVPLRELIVENLTPRGAKRLARCEDLDEVPELTLSDAMTIEAVEHFLVRGPWPRLRRIRILGLRGADPDDERWNDIRGACSAVFGDRLVG